MPLNAFLQCQEPGNTALKTSFPASAGSYFHQKSLSVQCLPSTEQWTDKDSDELKSGGAGRLAKEPEIFFFFFFVIACEDQKRAICKVNIRLGLTFLNHNSK